MDAEGNPFTKGAAANDWKVSPDLFPVEPPAVRSLAPLASRRVSSCLAARRHTL